MRKLFSTAIAIVVAISMLFPVPAHAIPKKFRNCPNIQQDGITYLLYGNSAIVRKVPNKENIVIPNRITYRKKKYVVAAIWDGTFCKATRLRKVDIKAAQLETIEDPAIFENRRIKVVVHDKATYQWLLRGGVNVVLR